MSEETTKPEGPISVDEAVDYQADKRAGLDPVVQLEKRREEADAGEVFESVDELMEHRNQKRQEAAEAEAQAEEVKRASRRVEETITEAEIAPKWSSEEVAALTTLDTSVQAFNNDLANLQWERDNVDIEGLRRTNPGAAEAWLYDISQRESELLNRKTQIEEGQGVARQHLHRKEHEKNSKQLFKLAPELKDSENRAALRSWLIGQGQDARAVDAEMNPKNLALAWKAMKAEKGEEPSKKGVVKLQRKSKPRPPKKPDVFRNIEDAVEYQRKLTNWKKRTGGKAA